MSCDVCEGRKTIRLPVLQRMVTFTDTPEEPPELMAAYRDYPCPECTEQIPYTRLGVLREVSSIERQSRLNEAQITDILTRQAAHAMIDRIIRDRLLTVEKVETVRGYELRCTLGLVAPKHVATLEERVAERQMEVAEELVRENIKEINNWGSFYGIPTVGKWQSIEWLQAALKKIREKRGARHQG